MEQSQKVAFVTDFITAESNKPAWGANVRVRVNGFANGFIACRLSEGGRDESYVINHDEPSGLFQIVSFGCWPELGDHLHGVAVTAAADALHAFQAGYSFAGLPEVSPA